MCYLDADKLADADLANFTREPDFDCPAYRNLDIQEDVNHFLYHILIEIRKIASLYEELLT